MKIIFTILISFALFSCNDEQIEKECDDITLKEVKRVFPNSTILQTPNYRSRYVYIVEDINNIKRITCSCHTYGGDIDHVELLEKK